MTILYILRNHDKIEQEACERILAARAKLNDERERIYARFGGTMKFTDEVFSGTRDPDAKIAAAMDELLLAEQEYIDAVAEHRETLNAVNDVAQAVWKMPEPYRALFISLYYKGEEVTLSEWETRQRIDEGLFILQKYLNPLERKEKP